MTDVVEGLFQVVCQLRDTGPIPDFGDEFTVSPIHVRTGTAKANLSFNLRNDGQGIRGTVEFMTSILDQPHVQDICQRIDRLLTKAVENPSQTLSQLPLLDAEEVRQVIASAHGPKPQPAARNVLDIIFDQARRKPEAPAVIAADGVMSYGELEAQSESI